MNQIEQLMALADEYANRKQWSTPRAAEEKRQALRVAIEQQAARIEELESEQAARSQDDGKLERAIESLQQQLADRNKQALGQGEPVGEVSAGTFVHWVNDVVPRSGTKLYTAPQPQRERVSLTEAEVSLAAHNEDPGDWNSLSFRGCWHKGFHVGFRAAEAKLREKNGGGV